VGFELPALRSLDALADHEPVILIDAREQKPLPFERLKTQTDTLPTGDYSVVGLENLFAVERKTRRCKVSVRIDPRCALTDRVRKYLAKTEPAISGQHGHDATFKVACALVWGFGLSPGEAFPLFAEWNVGCMPPWNERELRRKLIQASIHPNHQKPRGHLLGKELSPATITPNGPLPKPEPTWPKPNLSAIDRIVSAGSGLYDLWEKSPIRFEDGKNHAEEIIDVLLPGNPLLCVARSNELFATRQRETWRGRLATLPLMVPNPMIAVAGITQDGRWSEHTKHATAKRVYQVIEFDFSEKDKNGGDTIWAPLIRKWQESGITVLDACAALIGYLAERLPTLAVVCFSGGKSLHAWFRVFKLDKPKQREFMRYAVSLGADRATWTRSQLVRIPDGLRPNGARQTCHYLNPEEAVKAA
jgi:hypothetical protein